METKRKGIIWNITRICHYNCPICCVDGFYVKEHKSEIIINSNSLVQTRFQKTSNEDIYNEANSFLITQNFELALKDKLLIVENIDIPVSIDFSGGDPILINENLRIIIEASRKFGKENISISTTGKGLSKLDVEFAKQYVGHLEFTYDFPASKLYRNRPKDYNWHNLDAIKKFSESGVKLSAQISLTKENINKKIITNIYNDLKSAKIDDIFLMKIFPVGRGANTGIEEPTREEYNWAINFYKKLEEENTNPKIEIQSILQYTKKHNTHKREKYYISDSLNITNLGQLSLSPWAYDKNGSPLPEYTLGSLTQNKMSELYTSDSYSELYRKLNQNITKQI